MSNSASIDRLAIRMGDINEHVSDAMVCWAKPNLSPYSSTDAAIIHAGGTKLKQACLNWRSSHGELERGRAVLMREHSLASVTLFARVPLWSQPDAVQELRQALLQILSMASAEGVQTLTLTDEALDSAGWPLSDRSKLIAGTVAQFLGTQEKPNCIQIVCKEHDSFHFWQNIFAKPNQSAQLART